MGDNCEHGNDVRYGCKHCDDAGTEPPLARGRMTDLPDAETAWNEWALHQLRYNLDDAEAVFKAGFAAASGPWAEHPDALLYDAYREDSQRLIEVQTALDAALARNAELKERLLGVAQHVGLKDTYIDLAEYVASYVDRARRYERENAALRAELDSLRDRLNALADKWQDSEFRRKQPVLAYVGLDVAARDLTADREAFDREVARKGAEVGRMNAAIVRGSDDE